MSPVDHSPIKRLAMRRVLGGVLAVVLAVSVLVYRQCHPEWPKPLDDFQVTEAWLQCFDCQEGFFDRLDRMPDKHKDSVTRLLTAALLLGPDSAHRARFDQELTKTWLADSLHRVNRGETSKYEQNTYLARFRRGYVMTWQRRAAIGLGAIRSDSALAALDLALRHLPLNTTADSILHQTVERARSDSGINVP
jgi:hypothetical protein